MPLLLALNFFCALIFCPPILFVAILLKEELTVWRIDECYRIATGNVTCNNLKSIIELTPTWSWDRRWNIIKFAQVCTRRKPVFTPHPITGSKNESFCSELFMWPCKWEAKRRDLRLSEELNMIHPEWKPSVLTNTPCLIHLEL